MLGTPAFAYTLVYLFRSVHVYNFASFNLFYSFFSNLNVFDDDQWSKSFTQFGFSLWNIIEKTRFTCSPSLDRELCMLFPKSCVVIKTVSYFS